MIRILTFIVLIAIGCSAPEEKIRVMAAYPLCDGLTGEDAGGAWSIISTPTGSTLTAADIVGDCPSVDFDLFGCGTYVLMHTVESPNCTNCIDTEEVTFEQCCPISLSITPFCN